ncbi:MAG TPA: BlaI/MecI/CopY family transcriptional regulator [Flexivirga sp.]|uniref:BlaI/MecI/CopY family transcriptional regulator n=1 Tax=Flexivirga sp. TaxID=1962927 RepID=UPI002D1C8B87|nr:BlaI/MecI/CopY family transcriptional regulator [Flexivirga sp.]HWC22556.1 BlaI/MecI/CopY family transcriptional regulator [Flexivirga sp.]
MTRRSHGGLEDEVLRLLRSYGEPVTSRQLWEAFETDRPARTTLLTVLSRLEAKGLIQRTPAAGGALFSVIRTDAHTAARSMTEALDHVGDRRAALTHFAGELDSSDLDVLRRVLGQS